MEFKEYGLTEKQEAEAKRRWEEKVAAEVTADFLKRREERKAIENGWALNMNFLSGNQYCDLSPFGGLVEEDKRFYWQSRRAFNHIAPLVDARVAKIGKLQPTLTVRAFSDEDGDLKAAKLATGILKFTAEKIGLSETVAKAILWSEVCGSAFYKTLWDENGGRQVAVTEDGKPVYEGEVSVTAVSPFGIFPDNLFAEEISALGSIIHAQVVSVEYVKEKFGVFVDGEEVYEPSLIAYSEPSAGKQPAPTGKTTEKAKESVILIERYTAPSSEEKDGRLEIVAGGKLLYYGPLPYKNENREERGFPFVKQDSLRLPGAFFGSSVIDRLIPVQRAYNAVRNRKHEFLNRLSMGVLTVEDGSVDTDELAEEGLLPGKVLVYRQGGKAPEMLDCGNVPSEFKEEEEWLEQEFEKISGVSELTRNSSPTRVTSATGLQLLLAQDDSRLSATVSSMERAVKEVGRQILRLYKQFAGSARLMSLAGENKKAQAYYFSSSEVLASDIVFETESAASPERKREILLQLFEAGLLTEEDGSVSRENRHRILEAFGFGSYESAKDISSLHIAKAGEENALIVKEEIEPDDYDDHDLHIGEHTRFLLSAEFKKLCGKKNTDEKALKERFTAHMKKHEKIKKQKTNKEAD
ncbi:MAG: hypothetical protein IJ506_08190 [Clostridia bacterium]|nr:hypothetical protein [Clostridia bacterium]